MFTLPRAGAALAAVALLGACANTPTAPPAADLAVTGQRFTLPSARDRKVRAVVLCDPWSAVARCRGATAFFIEDGEPFNAAWYNGGSQEAEPTHFINVIVYEVGIPGTDSPTTFYELVRITALEISETQLFDPISPAPGVHRVYRHAEIGRLVAGQPPQGAYLEVRPGDPPADGESGHLTFGVFAPK